MNNRQFSKRNNFKQMNNWQKGLPKKLGNYWLSCIEFGKRKTIFVRCVYNDFHEKNLCYDGFCWHKKDDGNYWYMEVDVPVLEEK